MTTQYQQWEYVEVNRMMLKLDCDFINAMGHVGWELVCIFPDETKAIHYIFKRPKQ